jgi:hypothetical protein
MITAHRVYDDADGTFASRPNGAQIHLLGRLLGLFLLDLDGGPAVVVPANRAGVMDLLGLVAMRARLEVRNRDRQMGSAVALTGV